MSTTKATFARRWRGASSAWSQCSKGSICLIATSTIGAFGTHLLDSSVKIDSCGAQKNMSLYGDLFNRSGKAMQIEECHQGQNITDGGDPDQMWPGWCPYNMYAWPPDAYAHFLLARADTEPWLTHAVTVIERHTARAAFERAEISSTFGTESCPI